MSEAGAGIVTEPGDSAALARAIADLAACPTDLERMGHAARAYFDQHFTLDRAYRQFTAVLQESVQNNSILPLHRGAHVENVP